MNRSRNPDNGTSAQTSSVAAERAPGSQMRKDPWRYALPLLLVLYLTFAGLHATQVATGLTGFQNAPDEAAHVVFVRNVASFHLPTHDNPTPYTDLKVANGYEWHQPPLYYVLAAPFLLLGEQGPRWLSVLCGLASLVLIYRAARLLFPGELVTPSLAVGIAALTPTHIAITSTVNNDALLELCFSLSLFLLIGALQKGFDRRTALLFGAALGAAFLTKMTGLLLLPIFGFALYLMARAGAERKELLRNAGLAVGVALLVSGWWFARNQMLYGQPLPLRLFSEEFHHTMQASTMADAVGGWGAYYFQAALMTFRSFWAVFGITPHDASLGIPRFLPDQIYLLMAIACLCAGIGMIRVHLQRKTLFSIPQLQGLWVCFLTIALVGLSYMAFISKYFQMQGRYLFPAMLPITVVFAMSYRGLFPDRWKSAASLGLLSVLTVVTLAFLKYAVFPTP